MPIDLMAKRTAANWNDYTQELHITIRKQLSSQNWFAEEIDIHSRDKSVWESLPANVQDIYVKGLIMLTLLDTYQGDVGMISLVRSFSEEQHLIKANLTYMAMMENTIHAPSYSQIFTTYLSQQQIDEAFAWVEQHTTSQAIMNRILQHYLALDAQPNDTKIQWQAMVASVYLETWLFYSGFFYPLYFAGQGKLTGAGDVIALIIRDEQVHGLYVGVLARELFEQFSASEQQALTQWAQELLCDLYALQQTFIQELYSPVGLQQEVLYFTQYNANKALMNLGLSPYFTINEEQINTVVLQGLNVSQAVAGDMFSVKGASYIATMQNSGIDVTLLSQEQLEKEDF